ncbi:MAG: SusC/RagA family TonB-linked outer membrane protein [Gemmatimonadaceae bacterium]
MSVAARRSLLRLVALTLAGTAPLAAQPVARDSIVGTVADERGRPIQGARVTIDGSSASATTDVSGRFGVLNTGSGEVTVRVRAIGFSPLTRVIRTGSAPVELSLVELLVKLDEMVITGTAGAVEKRSLGNAITKVDAVATLAVAPVTDVARLLNGRASGVALTANSGMAGAGVKISIRGRNSLALTTQPIVYVDGIRIDAAPFTGPTVQGAAVISRLNDIDPSDIESIEVIKGPAAATLYGTEASNGVIQIITKSGHAGDTPRISVTVEQGTNAFMDPEGRIPTNSVRNAAGQIVTFNAAQNEKARGTPIWRTGALRRYDLSADGGSGTVSFRVGGNYLDEQGVDRSNSQRLMSGRANLQFLPRPSFSARVDLGLVTGKTSLTPQEGAGGPIFGAINANPLLKDAPSRGFFAGPPEVLYAVHDVFQLLRRSTGGVQLQHQVSGRFTQRLAAGVDFVQENNQNIVKRMTPTQAQFFSPLAAQGRKDVQLRDAATTTADYGASFTLPLRSSLTSTTAAGAQYYDRLSRFTNATGTQFAAPGLSTILATAVRSGSDDFVENATVGLYVQQQLALRDRLFLTGAVRVDNNSAFGKDYKLATYPKVSASWVVNEEPFWKLGFVNTLKLRAAYGAAGQQPDAFAALRTLGPVTGPGDQPALTTQSVGNDKLKPERSAELELGLDAGMFEQRLGIEFTYYRQNRRDAILQAPVAPSSGFIGTQLINAGEIRNTGAELKTTVVAVTGRRFGWDLSAAVSSNSNEITDLGGQPPIIVGIFPRAQRHQLGYPVAAFFGQRIVSATLDASGVAANLMCAGGPAATGPVPCATAPLVYLGRSTPRYEGAVTSTIRLFEHLRLYTMVDFKNGHKRFLTNEWARCTVFRYCQETYFPQKFSAIRNAYVQRGSGLLLTDGFIGKADFAKLREVSVNFDVPARWARSAGASRAAVTLSGRNLHTWTSWRGLDPESEQPGSFGELSSSEQAILPVPVQFRLMLNLIF